MTTPPDLTTLVGRWTYRSFTADPDLTTPFGKLEFGRATLELHPSPPGTVAGTIGDTSWSLALRGSLNLGDPFSLRFQGTGVVDGEQWVYDYVGYVTRPWPHGVDQVPTLTGSVIRTIPHSDGPPGTVAPAGVVCPWTAVWVGPAEG